MKQTVSLFRNFSRQPPKAPIYKFFYFAFFSPYNIFISAPYGHNNLKEKQK